MTVRPSRATLAIVVAAALAVAFAIGYARRERDEARCGDGFTARAGLCRPEGCPAPLVVASGACSAPPSRVVVPDTTLTLGPSDWEAQGQVTPRELRVKTFAIDAFEITRAEWQRAKKGATKTDGEPAEDGLRAMAGIGHEEASAFCVARGGALPTDDQWIAAAAGLRGSRYPWGDTGAVCRRAAWGLATGPCARGAGGADTVGAHASGATASGIYDLAGNVAEWTRGDAASAVAAVRGGSWRTELAAELRTWSRRELAKTERLDDVGFRCVYEP